MRKRIAAGRIAGVALLLAAAGCAPEPLPAPVIGPPPPVWKLDSFYAKSIDVDGIPISGSAIVPDAALIAAASIVREMLATRPDLTRALVARGQRVAVMAESEGTTDLPEQRDWKKPTRDAGMLTRCERKHYDTRIGALTDQAYWNSRARGLGGVLTSGAAENLLAKPHTRYYGENIFVHEFAHAMLDAIEAADPALYAAVKAAYADATARGLWKGEYGETNVHEYWAEGTQFWFESNKLVVIGNRRILSAKDMTRYDPALAAVLRRAYGDRHRLRDDAFWRHKARSPKGPLPKSTAEVC